MNFSIDGLGLVFVELEHLFGLPYSLLAAHHFLHLGLFDEVLAAVDLVLDKLVLLDEALVLLAHGVVLLRLCRFLGVRSAQLLADVPGLDPVDLPLVLLILNLLLLFLRYHLVQLLDLPQQFVLDIRGLVILLYLLQATDVLLLQYLEFILAAPDVVLQSV